MRPEERPSAGQEYADTGFPDEERELLDIVRRMLVAIHDGDLETYAAFSAPDLSCYETDIAPYRIDGLAFHLDLMRTMREARTYGALVRFDMLTPRAQVHGDMAVVTYTRLMTYAGPPPAWKAFNETRVFARLAGVWKMVHFHRSEGAS